MTTATVAGTGRSTVVEQCQVCDYRDLEPVMFLGYLPPVNQMPAIGEPPREQPSYPAQLLHCPRCQLVQLGLIVDPAILFPPEYPYTSGTTQILRDNFAQLYQECASLHALAQDDLVVDIGSNDGTLLSHFAPHHRVLGIEPTERGGVARERGIDTRMDFFTEDVARDVRTTHGQARIIIAANVFAHIEQIHSVLAGIEHLLAPDGIFISESHYVHALLETLQYDTIYHEHLRHYSVHSLQYLLRMHDLELVHAVRIPTHGGSIRVYAASTGTQTVQPSVQALLDQEAEQPLGTLLADFRRRVVDSKLQLYTMLHTIRQHGGRIYGISAPSRASTLINFLGLDDALIECVLEIQGSHKINKYMPGTRIPVLDESRLYQDPPEYALLFSWHIAEELMAKLRQRGYRGQFIVPLPEPRICGPA